MHQKVPALGTCLPFSLGCDVTEQHSEYDIMPNSRLQTGLLSC